MAANFVIGIDVGSGSARAAVFKKDGKMLGMASRIIHTWHPQPEFAEQSSTEIWRAVCYAVKNAMKQAGIAPAAIAGIAFDAANSLAAIDEHDRPVSLSPTGNDDQNIIMWMDHRAVAEAARLTRQGHQVISYLGGVVSPEHAIPKMMWVKKHLPESWKRTARFLDLADWLTYRATGRDVRSACTTVCKWTRLAHEKPGAEWSEEFFRSNRIYDALQRGAFGQTVEPIGTCAGGLNYVSARELGLEVGTPVAVGLIDAYAGGLGVLGMTAPRATKGTGSTPDAVLADINHVLCLIAGTSTCHMVVSKNPRFVPGVWGPYYSAMVPGLWANEGGQSATGALLDFVIASHPRHAEAQKAAKQEQLDIYAFLNRQVNDLARSRGVKHRAELTRDFHLLPYFHGNRSPHASPSARGAVHGLMLHATMEDFALQYYATLQALAYGTKDIIDSLNARGYRISRMHACGGGSKNSLWLQEHADATQCEILLPREPEAVLLGSAMVAAVGAGVYRDIPSAMAAMSAVGSRIIPDKATAAYHRRKMRIHRELYADQQKYTAIMAGKAPRIPK